MFGVCGVGDFILDDFAICYLSEAPNKYAYRFRISGWLFPFPNDRIRRCSWCRVPTTFSTSRTLCLVQNPPSIILLVFFVLSDPTFSQQINSNRLKKYRTTCPRKCKLHLPRSTNKSTDFGIFRCSRASEGFLQQSSRILSELAGYCWKVPLLLFFDHPCGFL